ncbi:rhodanese-like domain-containing protein [Puniceicoccaceae bacterium K14]|nr:rhodanese-like domain-containing protein [Puniceicoccaceae bacterium K14]
MNDQIKHYQDKLRYEIDSWDLYSSKDQGQPITVIDARAKDAFKASHIPGAINLPHREMSETTTSNLSKEILYVTYCDGIGCNASTKGALKMSELGFQVKELMGGLDWWIRDGYATEGQNGTPGKQSIQCGCA